MSLQSCQGLEVSDLVGVDELDVVDVEVKFRSLSWDSVRDFS